MRIPLGMLVDKYARRPCCTRDSCYSRLLPAGCGRRQHHDHVVALLQAVTTAVVSDGKFTSTLKERSCATPHWKEHGIDGTQMIVVRKHARQRQFISRAQNIDNSGDRLHERRSMLAAVYHIFSIDYVCEHVGYR